MSKMGRPTKYAEGWQLLVYNSFLVEKMPGREDTLKQRGLYKALAEYAQQKGYPGATADDFSKSEAIRELSGVRKAESLMDNSEIAAFVPLSRGDLERKSQNELVELILSRDAVFERMYKAFAVAIDNRKSMMAEAEALRCELNKRSETQRKKDSEIGDATKKIKEMERQIRELERYIKDNVNSNILEIVDKELKAHIYSDLDVVLDTYASTDTHNCIIDPLLWDEEEELM